MTLRRKCRCFPIRPSHRSLSCLLYTSSKLDRYLAGELPNIFNPALETGAFMDLGVYCVYPALALFGKPESFTMEPQMLESGADGAGILTMRYPDKLVTLTYSKLGESLENTEFQGCLLYTSRCV